MWNKDIEIYKSRNNFSSADPYYKKKMTKDVLQEGKNRKGRKEMEMMPNEDM